MLVAWLLVPVLLLVLCLGCGLLVERVAGHELPGPLLPAVGLGLFIVVASLTTRRAATAPFTTMLVVVLAVGGLALGRRRLRSLRPDPWLVACGVGLFTVCAAPVVASGQATFLGYFVNSDSSFHFELASWLLAHGHDLTGVPAVDPSATTNLLHEYIGTAYPTGADVLVGAVNPLAGQDIAWIYQPVLAVVLALGGVALAELIRGPIGSRPLRAACGFIAAQGGLAYAFYLELSAKEVFAALLITTTVALIFDGLSRPPRPRRAAPLIVVVLAGADVYSVTIVPWVGPALAALVAVLAWRGWKGLPAWRRAHPRVLDRETLGPAAAWGLTLVIALVLAEPVLAGASTFTTVASSVLSDHKEMGNLAAPLPFSRVLGIWPNGDFRYPLGSDAGLAYALMGVATVSGGLGVLWALRRRAWAPLLLLATEGISTAYLLHRASPYAASKVLMLMSVAVGLFTMLGAAALFEARRRIEATALAALVAAGVLWTTFVAYHDSSVAPRARLQELASIGHRFAGRGEAFYDLWDTNTAYFLRQVRASVPSTFAGPPPSRPGLPPHAVGLASLPWDPNELPLDWLEQFPLLVLGRSPDLSRPPADYRQVDAGRYYEVWRRTATPAVLQHFPFSYGADALTAPRPTCRAVRAIGAQARREHARLAYVPLDRVPELTVAHAAHPPTWVPVSASASGVTDVLAMGQFPGALTGIIDVPRAGTYDVLVQGVFSRPVAVFVGRRYIGTLAHQIGTAGQYLPVGSISLPAGPTPVLLNRPAATLRPGNVLGGEFFRSVALVPAGLTRPVATLAAADATRLCHRPVQWIEIVK